MSDTAASPTTGPAPRPARRFRPRHLAYLGLLAVVVVCVIVLVQKSSTNATDLDGGAIERLIPTPGSKIFQQDGIGIDLAPGYEGTLALNGTPLPEDQLLVVPQLNQVTFQPGPGKELEALPPGENCVVATYWESQFGPSESTSRSWCFTVF